MQLNQHHNNTYGCDFDGGSGGCFIGSGSSSDCGGIGNDGGVVMVVVVMVVVVMVVTVTVVVIMEIWLW